MAQLIYGGVTKPLRQPFRQPYEPIHIASVSDEVLRIAFENPLLASRLVLPADYANDKLKWMNQKNGSTYGNPVKGVDYGLLTMLINSGSSVYLHKTYGDPQTLINPTITWDKANNKLTVSNIYLDNDKEENDPVVIYDDDESVWSVGGSGEGSYGLTVSEETTIKQKGTSSLKMVVGTGSNRHVWALYTYGSEQDFSDKEFLCLWLYGANTGLSVYFILYTPDGNNFGYWNFVDNFTGFKRFILPLNNPDTEVGTYDLSKVKVIYIEYLNVNQTFTAYLDRIVVDVGQWAKVEAYVPDALLNENTGIKMYAWDGAAYQYYRSWNPYDVSSFAGEPWLLEFLDGTVLEDFLSDAYLGLGRTEIGGRGEDPDDVRCSGSFSSYYGALKRFMFAVKMPPDDGQDASDAGISQCKLKLEVFYADSLDPAGVQGQATYEFKNDAHQFYGLTNWLEPWMAVFDATLKKAFYFIFSERPTGLKVCADEDEQIHWIEATLPAGCRVYAGELYFDNMTRDTDADGAPDFLQTVLSDLSKGVAIW